MIPASTQAFVLDTYVGRLLLFGGIESEMAQDGKILSDMVFADALPMW
jgi:hypothetical protein